MKNNCNVEYPSPSDEKGLLLGAGTTATRLRKPLLRCAMQRHELHGGSIALGGTTTQLVDGRQVGKLLLRQGGGELLLQRGHGARRRHSSSSWQQRRHGSQVAALGRCSTRGSGCTALPRGRTRAEVVGEWLATALGQRKNGGGGGGEDQGRV